VGPYANQVHILTSHAYADFGLRMRDVDQLVQAHTALTQFWQARRAYQRSRNLQNVSKVISKLLRRPGRGRRPAEFAALNRATIVLLSAHLQGFIQDIYSEAAHVVLNGKVRDIDSLISRGKKSFGNPHAYRIEQLFCTIGFPKVLRKVRWQKTSNQTVRKRLTQYVRLRNEIAHGKRTHVTKAQVLGFRKFVEQFALRFDVEVGSEIRNITGAAPW
jgi:hypothetical protein